jgi:hypothetical protein
VGFVVDKVTLGQENLCCSLRTLERLTNNLVMTCSFILYAQGQAALAYTALRDLKLMFFLALYSVFTWQHVTEEKWVTMSSRWRSSIDMPAPEESGVAK